MMTYLEKINSLHEQLNLLKNKLDGVDEDLLVSRADKEDLVKVKHLLNFHLNAVINMKDDFHEQRLKKQKEFTLDLVKEIEKFIVTLNNSLNV
jgi:hypothetical protein